MEKGMGVQVRGFGCRNNWNVMGDWWTQISKKLEIDKQAGALGRGLWGWGSGVKGHNICNVIKEYSLNVKYEKILKNRQTEKNLEKATGKKWHIESPSGS